MSALRTSLFFLLVASPALIVALWLYVWRPWGNETLQVGDATKLLAMLVYAVTPYLGMLLLSTLFRADKKTQTVFLIGACVVAGLGFYTCVDATVFNRSALSALAFIAAPTCQWFVLAVQTIGCLAMRNLRAMRDDDVYDQ